MRNGLRDSSSKGFVYCNDLNCNVTLFCKEVKKMEYIVRVEGMKPIKLASVKSVQISELSYDVYDENRSLIFSAPREKVEFIGKVDKMTNL